MLFMLMQGMGHRRMASIEQAMFESNAGRAATYENHLFYDSSNSRSMASSSAEEGMVPRTMRVRGAHSGSNRLLSPSHAWRKTTYFYQPLDLQGEDTHVAGGAPQCCTKLSASAGTVKLV